MFITLVESAFTAVFRHLSSVVFCCVLRCLRFKFTYSGLLTVLFHVFVSFRPLCCTHGMERIIVKNDTTMLVPHVTLCGRKKEVVVEVAEAKKPVAVEVSIRVSASSTSSSSAVDPIA